MMNKIRPWLHPYELSVCPNVPVKLSLLVLTLVLKALGTHIMGLKNSLWIYTTVSPARRGAPQDEDLRQPFPSPSLHTQGLIHSEGFMYVCWMNHSLFMRPWYSQICSKILLMNMREMETIMIRKSTYFWDSLCFILFYLILLAVLAATLKRPKN